LWCGGDIEDEGDEATGTTGGEPGSSSAIGARSMEGSICGWTCGAAPVEETAGAMCEAEGELGGRAALEDPGEVCGPARDS
jgi:hypothetical protein